MIVALCLLLIGSALTADGFEWPVEGPSVVRTFGEFRDQFLSTGIAVTGESSEIHPIAPGEIVFHRDRIDNTGSVPKVLGNFLVLQHSGNLRSIYAHLRAGSSYPAVEITSASAVVGSTGSTGMTTGTWLGLAIIDMEISGYINPLSVLPPLADTRSPIIRGVSLHSPTAVVDLPTDRTIPANRYEIRVNAFDLREDVSFVHEIAPYQLTVTLLGRESSRITLQSFIASNGVMMLGDTRQNLSEIYVTEDTYRLGIIDLTTGEMPFSLSVRDFARNDHSMSFLVKAE